MIAVEQLPALSLEDELEQLVRGRATLEGPAPLDAGGCLGGDGGFDLPPSSPPPADGRRRRRTGGDPPRWQRVLLWTAILLLGAVASMAIANLTARLAIVLERGLERGES